MFQQKQFWQKNKSLETSLYLWRSSSVAVRKSVVCVLGFAIRIRTSNVSCNKYDEEGGVREIGAEGGRSRAGGV